MLAWDGPALKSLALVTACTALPPEGAVLAWDGPALRTMFLSLQQVGDAGLFVL